MSTASSLSSQECLDQPTPLPPTKSSLKRLKSSQDFYESLVCPVCCDFFKPPIVNCRKGHSFCLTCIEQMEQTVSQRKCPLCRGEVDKDSRNLVLEEQLGKINVKCSWNQHGCRRRVSLSERSLHEKHCKHKPNPISCVHAGHLPPCSWQGNSCLLPKHLRIAHAVEPIERAKTVKFLWNIPDEEVDKFRYRSLFISYPTGSKSSFLLEFVYLSEPSLCLFIVKSLDPEVALKYRVSILNRDEPENCLTFQDTTPYYGDFPMACVYPNYDTRRVFGVPLYFIRDYSFMNEVDNTYYFSCHIEFYTLKEVDN